MSTFDDNTTRIYGLDSLISEVPNLLGFVPADSLVLLCFEHAGENPASAPVTVRTDLPPAENCQALVAYLVPQVFSKVQAEFVIALVVGSDQGEQRGLIDALEADSHWHGIELHAMWTPALRAGNKWICYQDAACAGYVHDTSASPLAAATAAAGFHTYGSREEIAETIAPASDAERDEVQRQLEEWLFRTGPAESLREAAAPVFNAMERLRAGEPLETDQIVAALGALNGDVRVRDLMFTIHDTVSAQLWTILLRKAPDAYVPNVAVLSAAGAQLRGDGGLANIAVERALAASPTHPLAIMLDQVLQFPPQELRRIIDDVASKPDLQLD
ncbi:DUF4192 domain-containing protein [Saccharopolyspora sp. SCSIO 74807]|uniref:DUF4192 domain-containing protein n=1 Tax=Saccharopolyspora sp. SCSIO 74807 TaxID=3118084 RepID=UPI0030CB1C71